MITYLTANFFDSKVQVLTNAVNCVGAMGKGVALEFKKRYPAMHSEIELELGLQLRAESFVSIKSFKNSCCCITRNKSKTKK
jgi:O-acetyl-ADP-ribose deacetylase (regulator of RNase III)